MSTICCLSCHRSLSLSLSLSLSHTHTHIHVFNNHYTLAHHTFLFPIPKLQTPQNCKDLRSDGFSSRRASWRPVVASRRVVLVQWEKTLAAWASAPECHHLACLPSTVSSFLSLYGNWLGPKPHKKVRISLSTSPLGPNLIKKIFQDKDWKREKLWILWRIYG